MTPIVKAADAAQFVSLVPRLLGFHPRRSLVLVPFQDSRSLGAMRFDLPTRSEDADSVAATIIGMLCRLADAEGFAAVVYCDEAYGPFDARPPHHALVDALRERADACGLAVVDAQCVAADAWGSYLDDEPLRRALDDLAPDDAIDPAHLDADQSTGAILPKVDAMTRSDVKRAIHQLRRAMDAFGTDETPSSVPRRTARIDPLALQAAQRFDDLPELFEQMLTWDAATLDPFHAALLSWCLNRPALRDIALVQWAAGPEAGQVALDAQLRWEAGEEYPAALGRIMWGDADQPDPKRLDSALALARALAAAVPRRDQPGPLATAAWLSWGLGRSTHAGRYATQALAIAPAHGLSEIVMAFVNAGHLPDWAFRRSATHERAL